MWHVAIINSKTNLSENDEVLVLFINFVINYFVNYYSPGFLLSTTVQLRLLPAGLWHRPHNWNCYLLCLLLSLFELLYGSLLYASRYSYTNLKIRPVQHSQGQSLLLISMWGWLLEHFYNFCWWIYVLYHDQTVFLFCLSVSCSLHWRFWIGYTLQKLYIKRSSCTNIIKSWMCN